MEDDGLRRGTKERHLTKNPLANCQRVLRQASEFLCLCRVYATRVMYHQASIATVITRRINSQLGSPFLLFSSILISAISAPFVTG